MAAGSSPRWTTIESDPGVFTELIEQMGVTGVQVEELYAIEPGTLQYLRPVYGLIFLFKWRHEEETRPATDADIAPVYFARQVISDACATQAIISILFNAQNISLGKELSDFRDFTADFSPELKGESLGHSELIRQSHNSFAAPHAFVSEDSQAAKDDDDVFHFIAYVPAAGHLWELDGLKKGPINLCECSEGDWLERVQPIIQERVERYASSEIRFNLMAVVADRREGLKLQLQDLQAQQDRHELQGGDDQSILELAKLRAESAQVQQELKEEVNKRSRWRDDNISRKHNYIPLLFTLLRLSAQRGRLQPLLDAAKVNSSSSQD